MSQTADAVVIGAGIVGAACAEALAAAGLAVAVVEAGVVGGGATAAGMGHIVVMDDSEAQFALTACSRQLWLNLAAQLPAQVEYDPCGTLWVAADDEEMQAVRSKHELYGSKGVRTSILDEGQLAAAEPNLRPGLAGALLVPEDCVIYSPAAALWLLRRQPGVKLTVSRAQQIGDGEVSLQDGSRISAGAVVCAAGMACLNHFPWLPMRPRKGHLAITGRSPGFARHQLVELGYLKSAHGHAQESVAFNVQPRMTGQVLVGSSRQYGIETLQVDSPVLGRMLRRAFEFMPALARISVIRTWTGFRAATIDKLPIIGPAPGRDRTWLATGHEGLGITTSLATGALIAAMILRHPPPIDPAPYSPERFGASYA
jgi:glycine/D-amino acid oxidase-like deaminating enzyme